jgi:hypothetical protein
MDLSMEDSESERNELERFRRLMQQLEEEMGEEAH